MYDKHKVSRLQKYYQFVNSICTEKDSVFIILCLTSTKLRKIIYKLIEKSIILQTK